MLVLTRSRDQSVMIGNDLVVAVADMGLDRVLITVCRRTGGGRAPVLQEVAKHWMHVTDAVLIADGITCIVVAIDYGKVRLGFKCPPEIKIHRSEVYEEIQRKNQSL